MKLSINLLGRRELQIAVHMCSIEEVWSLREALSDILNNSLCPFATTLWLLIIVIWR